MMKNKTLVAIFLISGMMISSRAFGIEDTPTAPTDNTQQTQSQAQEQPITPNTTTLVENVEYTNDIFSEFTLEDCIKIAIKNNLSVQSSLLTDAMFKEKIGQAWASYFPELGLGVNWNRTRDYTETYNASALPQVSANIMLFDFGKTKAKADTAKNTYLAKTMETEEHINVLICDIKKAYYKLLFAQAQYLVYVDTVKDFELQKKQAFSLYSAGKKAKVDVAIADYNLCKAQLSFEKAKNTLSVAKYELSRLMGFPEYNNYELKSELGKNIYSINLEKAINSAYDVRPELLAAKRMVDAAKTDLRAKKRDFTPDLKANVGYGNNMGTYGYNSYGFGANLSYSNFNVMKTKKVINEANIAYNKSQIDLEDVKQSLYLKIHTAYENLQTAEQSINIAQNALEQAKEQYRQTSGRYKAGIADIIELKDGENAYLNARLDYYSSLLNYDVSVAEFEKEIGTPINNYLN